MGKTIKFTISMPAAEFRDIESLRGKTGRKRSQFIRDAVAALRDKPAQPLSVKEEHSEYGAPPTSGVPQITDLAERRRRAIEAAGKFRSGTPDLSSDHDRHLEEAFMGGPPEKNND